MFATASSLKPIEEVLDDTFKQVKSLVNGAQLLSAIKVLDATEAKIKKAAHAYKSGTSSLVVIKNPDLVPYYLYDVYSKRFSVYMRLVNQTKSSALTSQVHQDSSWSLNSYTQSAISDAKLMISKCPHEPMGYYSLAKAYVMNQQHFKAYKILRKGLDSAKPMENSSMKFIESFNKLKKIKQDLKKRIPKEQLAELGEVDVSEIKQENAMDGQSNTTPNPVKVLNLARPLKQMELNFKTVTPDDKQQPLFTEPSDFNKQDPMQMLPYYDVFRPILMRLDFATILECTKVCKRWRRVLTMHDTAIIPDKLDLTFGGKKRKWKLKDLDLVLKKATGLRSRVVERIDLLGVDSKQLVEIVFNKYIDHVRHISIECRKKTPLFDFFTSKWKRNGRTFNANGMHLESLELHGACTMELVEVILPLYPNLKKLRVNNTIEKTPDTFRYICSQYDVQRKEELHNSNQMLTGDILLDNLMTMGVKTTRNIHDIITADWSKHLEDIELLEMDWSELWWLLYKYLERHTEIKLKRFALSFQKQVSSPDDYFIRFMKSLTCLQYLSVSKLPTNVSPLLLSKSLNHVELVQNRWFNLVPHDTSEEQHLGLNPTKRVSVPSKARFGDLLSSSTLKSSFVSNYEPPLNNDYSYCPSDSITSPSFEQYPVQTLRASNCVVSSVVDIPDLHRFFARLGCGSNLKALYLEYFRLPVIYDSDGYHQVIRKEFPNLELLSLAGNTEVGNHTAAAIVERQPFPACVILSHTSVTAQGIWKMLNSNPPAHTTAASHASTGDSDSVTMIPGGLNKINTNTNNSSISRIKFLGIQRLNLSFIETQDISKNGNVKLLEFKRFVPRYNANDKVI